METTPLKRVLLAGGLVGLLAFAFAAPAVAQDAPGNNGTIKVHDGAGEPADEHKTEPQVCTFHVHAFNFDPNQQLTYTITNTETDEVAETGSFTVNDDGEGRDPESGAMSVDDAGSYRLEVTTDDGSKSKVFQVTCEGGVLGGTLANTGGETAPYLTAAGLLMMVGASLILRSRRRLWGRAAL